jgi:hypothetical protein
MKSALRGRSTLAVELANVSSHGFWLLVGDRERFLPFSQFPWFRDATIGQLSNVTLPSPHHVYWPDLDIDLAVDSIDHPERYPLVSRVSPERPTGQVRSRERGRTTSVTSGTGGRDAV